MDPLKPGTVELSPKLFGIPENSPLGSDQFIELMHRVEKFDAYGYICFVYSLAGTSLDFNPYRFKILRYSKLTPKSSFYTLSKYGILFFSGACSAEYTSIAHFETQMQVYDHIIKIPFFAKYRLWKSFMLWRTKIRGRKLTLLRSSLLEDLFINKRPLRLMLKELVKMCEKMSHMGLLKLKSAVTYSLEEFLTFEAQHAKEVLERLRDFEAMVVEMTAAACRATLIEDGFSPDSYPEEISYYMKQLDLPGAAAQTPHDYPGQWLSYSQQIKKRNICRRLTDFIRLVDYYIQNTYFRIMKNSMVYLMQEMEQRVKHVPAEYSRPVPYTDQLEDLVQEHEKHGGTMVLSASSEPLFDVGCSWTDEDLVFSPSLQDYIKGFRFLFQTWKSTIMSYENMVRREVFNPYTQPIINGYVEQKTCGDGPDMELIIQNDAQLIGVTDVLHSIIKHGFQVCDSYIKMFDYIRVFCLENQRQDLDHFRKEQDVRVLKELMDKFHKQMEILKEVEDIQNMGVFRVNNSILRAHAHPTISRCTDVLRHHIPEVVDSKVHSAREHVRTAIETFNRYPKDTFEYVERLLYLQRILPDLEQVDRELAICQEFFDMMHQFEIPSHEETRTVFEQVGPQLENLKLMAQEQLQLGDQFMSEVQSKFQEDIGSVRAKMEEIRVIVEAPEMLDSHSDPEAMISKLTAVNDDLLAEKENADRIQEQERKLKLPVTKFNDLDQLISFARNRHQLWDSIRKLEKQKVEWEETKFIHINGDVLAREVNEYVGAIEKLEVGLPPNEVLPNLKAKVETLRMQVPWITFLRNPNLKDRHWKMLNKVLGVNLLDESVTLKKLLDLGVTNYTDVIQEISDQATNEHQLEQLLRKVIDSWAEVEFQVLPYKEMVGVYVLSQTEEIQALLDQSKRDMETITGSRFVGPIKPKVDQWNKLLDIFGQTLEEWVKCQNSWIRFEHIFSASDVQRQFPNEARLFAQVDNSWREIMSKTNRNPSAIRAGTAIGTLEALRQNNELFEQIEQIMEFFDF